jgi:hypothetical protein
MFAELIMLRNEKVADVRKLDWRRSVTCRKDSRPKQRKPDLAAGGRLSPLQHTSLACCDKICDFITVSAIDAPNGKFASREGALFITVHSQ